MSSYSHKSNFLTVCWSYFLIASYVREKTISTRWVLECHHPSVECHVTEWQGYTIGQQVECWSFLIGHCSFTMIWRKQCCHPDFMQEIERREKGNENARERWCQDIDGLTMWCWWWGESVYQVLESSLITRLWWKLVMKHGGLSSSNKSSKFWDKLECLEAVGHWCERLHITST